jgi:GT2 family glycosyltransferase
MMTVAQAIPPSQNPITQARITVSVVSHGHREIVASLLQQISDLRNSDIARVIVVHNLPDADLQKPLSAQFELIQLHNEKAKGFSANHNMAFLYCVTPWFAVLNPDIEFQHGDPFPALLSAGEADARLGMVAPALVQPDTGLIEPNRGFVSPLELIRRRLPGWVPPEEPAWLVGAFLLIRASTYKELGGFDERFRLYCEDVELGLRLKHAGWLIRRLESTKVIHLTERGSHRSLKLMFLHVVSLFRLWAIKSFIK